MIKQQPMVPLFLALSLWAAPLLAQTTDTEKPSTSESASTGSDKSAGAQETPAKGPATKSKAPTVGNDSPFDYRASEQISEDVPVSFPVDI